MTKLRPLRERKEFTLLSRTGYRVESGSFRLFWRRKRTGDIRLAVVIPRATDKRATKRNLLRRRAKEWFRKNLHELGEGLDAALFVKKDAVYLPRKQFYEELHKITSRLRERK